MSVLGVRDPLVIVPVSLPQPGFPIAVWIGTGEVVGDASGGDATALVGAPSFAQSVASVFSCDGLSVRVGVGGADPFNISWDPGYPSIATNARFCRFAGVTALGGSANVSDSVHVRIPFWPLSFPAPSPAGAGWRLSAAFANVLNRVYDLTAWGRCWDANIWRKGGPRGWLPPG